MALIHYLPAELHEGKIWYISYYVLHPETNILRRKRIKFNRINSIVERRKQAKRVCQQINIKLASGWNPFLEKEAPKAFYKLFDVIDTFMNEKKRESRDDTIRTYKSYTKIFKEWIKCNKSDDIYAGNFSRQDAVNVSNYLYMKRKLAERSFNGFLVYFNSLFNWMVRNMYIKDNPFKTIKRKKVKPKKRILLTAEDRNKLKKYLNKNNYQEFYCMILLAYYGLIRPQEITYLKKEYLYLDKKIIVLPGSITKNGKDRVVSLPLFVINELDKLHLSEISKTMYIFSDNFKPGKKKINRRVISNFWARNIRPGAKLKKEIQFYSLRDTGIIEMLKNGISPNEVKDQADHSSIEITNEYLKHANPKGIDSIKNGIFEF